MARRLVIISLTILGLIVAALFVVAIFRLQLAETGLRYVLRLQQIPGANLTVSKIGVDETRIENFSVGDRGELRARTIVLRYDAERALEGKLSAIEIDGLALQVDVTGEGPLLGSLQRLLAGTKRQAPDDKRADSPSPKSLPSIPLDSLILTDGRIEALTPLGPAALQLEADLKQQDSNTLQAAASLRLRSAFAKLAAGIEASMTPAGNLTVEATISEGSAKINDLSSNGLEGAVHLNFKDTRDFDLAADLVLGELATPWIDFAAGQMALAADPEQAATRLSLQPGKSGSNIALYASVDDYLDQPRVELTLHGRSDTTKLPWSIPMLPSPSAGTIKFDLKTSASLPALASMKGSLEPSRLLAQSKGEARLAAAIENLTMPARFENLSGQLDIEARLADQQLEVTLPRSTHVSLSGLAVAWLSELGLPPAAQALLTGPLHLQSGGEDSAPFAASLDLSQPPITLTLPGGGLRLAAGDTTMEASSTGEIRFDQRALLDSFDMQAVDIITQNLSLAGATIDHLSLVGRASGNLKTAKARLVAKVESDRVAVDRMTLRKLVLDLPIEGELENQRLHIELPDNAQLSAKSLSVPGLVKTLDPLRVDFTSEGITLAPVLASDTKEGEKKESPALDLDLLLSTEPLRIELTGDTEREPQRLQVRPGRLRLAGTGPLGSDEQRLSAEWQGAGVSASAQQVKLSGVTARLDLLPIKEGRVGRFSLGSLAHQGTPAWFNPIGMKGSIWRKGDTLSLDGKVASSQNQALVDLVARHNLKWARGGLQATLNPIAFFPGGLQPSAFSPLLKRLKDTSGTITGDARLTWSSGGLGGDARIAVEDLSTKAEGLTLAGLSLDLVLDSLFPLSSGPGQQLSARLIDPAIPLRDLKIAFQLKPAEGVTAGALPLLLVEHGGLTADGLVLALPPTRIDPTADKHALTVEIVDLDMQPFLNLFQVEGLSGTGRFAGSLPVEMTATGAVVKDAEITAQGPGTLRYSAGTAADALAQSGQELDLVLRALEDFRYDDLTLTFATKEDLEATVTVKMAGKNPAVLDGHPFAFNVNLETDLGKFAPLFLEGYRFSLNRLRDLWRNRQ